MPNFTTEVDVYIEPDEFSDREIIDEVKRRLVDNPKSSSDKKFRRDIETALYGDNRNGHSLLDQMKIEIIHNNLHKKSLDEIEKFFK